MRSSLDFLRTLTKKNPLFAFFSLTYLFASVDLLFQGLHNFGQLRMNAFSWYTAEALLSPAAAALIVQWLTEHNLKVCRIHNSWKSFGLAFILGPGLVLLSVVIIPAVLASKEPLQSLNWKVFLSAASYHCQYSGGFIGLLFSPIVEEPGWRGYALPRLQSLMSPGWASILLGLLWAGWHFPSFLIQGSASGAILRYMVVVIALSVLIGFGFNLSRFSILVAVAMHAFCNMRGCLLQGLASDTQDRAHSSVIWTCSMFLVPAALLLVTRGRLGIPREDVCA